MMIGINHFLFPISKGLVELVVVLLDVYETERIYHEFGWARRTRVKWSVICDL